MAEYIVLGIIDVTKSIASSVQGYTCVSRLQHYLYGTTLPEIPQSICTDVFIVIIDCNTAWSPFLPVFVDGAAIAGHTTVFAVAEIAIKTWFCLNAVDEVVQIRWLVEEFDATVRLCAHTDVENVLCKPGHVEISDGERIQTIED